MPQVTHGAHQILQEFRPVPVAFTNIEVIYKWSFGQATEHRGCDPGAGLAHVPGSIFLACPPGRVFAAPSSGWPHWRQVALSHAKGGVKTATSVRSTPDKRGLGYPFNRSSTSLGQWNVLWPAPTTPSLLGSFGLGSGLMQTAWNGCGGLAASFVRPVVIWEDGGLGTEGSCVLDAVAAHR